MGYTHYYYQLRTFSDGEWSRIIDRLSKVIKANPDIALAGGMGTGEPAISVDEIVFNGSNRLNEDYETMALSKIQPEPGEYFDCVKTAHKPYDKIVTALLAIARDEANSAIRISSDGGQEAFDLGGLPS